MSFINIYRILPGSFAPYFLLSFQAKAFHTWKYYKYLRHGWKRVWCVSTPLVGVTRLDSSGLAIDTLECVCVSIYLSVCNTRLLSFSQQLEVNTLLPFLLSVASKSSWRDNKLWPIVYIITCGKLAAGRPYVVAECFVAAVSLILQTSITIKIGVLRNVTPFSLVILASKSEKRAASVFTGIMYIVMIIIILTAIIISIILNGTPKLQEIIFLGLQLMEVLKNEYQSKWNGGIAFIRNALNPYQSAWCHSSENDVHKHRCDNPKSYRSVNICHFSTRIFSIHLGVI